MKMAYPFTKENEDIEVFPLSMFSPQVDWYPLRTPLMQKGPHMWAVYAATALEAVHAEVSRGTSLEGLRTTSAVH